jgi:hypothetical protein
LLFEEKCGILSAICGQVGTEGQKALLPASNQSRKKGWDSFMLTPAKKEFIEFMMYLGRLEFCKGGLL